MRVTARDPEARRLRVFLDGVEVTSNCFEADDDAGYAHCYLRDSEGRIQRDPDSPNDVLTVKRHGKVEFKPLYIDDERLD